MFSGTILILKDHIVNKILQFKLQGEKDWQKYETARKLKVNSVYCAVYLLPIMIENLMTHFVAIINIHLYIQYT